MHYRCWHTLQIWLLCLTPTGEQAFQHTKVLGLSGGTPQNLRAQNHRLGVSPNLTQSIPPPSPLPLHFAPAKGDNFLPTHLAQRPALAVLNQSSLLHKPACSSQGQALCSLLSKNKLFPQIPCFSPAQFMFHLPSIRVPVSFRVYKPLTNSV